jgi:hypothetical protein
MSEDRETSGLSNVVRIDDERIRDHLSQIVRGTVEETLNSLLAAEADRLCNAAATSGRKLGGTSGLALSAPATHPRRRGDAQGAEAPPADL